MVDQPADDTLADWEGEGGRIAATNGSSGCPPPWLPAGYQVRCCLGFRGRPHYYEFNRVYGPPDRLDERGPISRLDEDLSYWQRTPGTYRHDPAARQVTYAQACTMLGASLSFARFSSVRWMREKLPALFEPPSPSLMAAGDS